MGNNNNKQFDENKINQIKEEIKNDIKKEIKDEIKNMKNEIIEEIKNMKNEKKEEIKIMKNEIKKEEKEKFQNNTIFSEDISKNDKKKEEIYNFQYFKLDKEIKEELKQLLLNKLPTNEEIRFTSINLFERKEIEKENENIFLKIKKQLTK